MDYADEERAAIVAWLRGGGDRIRGVWYSWDNEMSSYARGFADDIERGDHHLAKQPEKDNG